MVVIMTWHLTDSVTTPAKRQSTPQCQNTGSLLRGDHCGFHLLPTFIFLLRSALVTRPIIPWLGLRLGEVLGRECGWYLPVALSLQTMSKKDVSPPLWRRNMRSRRLEWRGSDMLNAVCGKSVSWRLNSDLKWYTCPWKSIWYAI